MLLFAGLNDTGEEGGGGGAVPMLMIRGLGVLMTLGVIFVG